MAALRPALTKPPGGQNDQHFTSTPTYGALSFYNKRAICKVVFCDLRRRYNCAGELTCCWWCERMSNGELQMERDIAKTLIGG